MDKREPISGVVYLYDGGPMRFALEEIEGQVHYIGAQLAINHLSSDPPTLYYRVHGLLIHEKDKGLVMELYDYEECTKQDFIDTHDRLREMPVISEDELKRIIPVTENPRVSLN